jgi:PEP-CTERM motif-containing protein
MKAHPSCAKLALTAAIAAAALAAQAAPANAAVTFSPFVASGDIASAVGQTNTIGFTYAGNKFVGSVYFGANNLQLFSTDLTGHNVQAFGSPLPNGSGEVVLAGSLGQGGFASGDIYASGANTNIYHYGNGGGAPSLFATLPGEAGQSRQIFFDPGSTFGGDMIVTTTSGRIYTVDNVGTVNQLANLGADTEGMDIASSAYGQYAGQLLVVSEGTGQVHAITSGGAVSTLLDASHNPIFVSVGETLSVVPLNFGQSGDPLEGFYVADYPVDIQKAGIVSQFQPYLGDAILTSEFGVNSTLWDLSYNGDAANTFNLTSIGTMPFQSEDGIFVTAQRIVDTGGGVPEPGAWAMMILGFGAVGSVLRRRKTALAV